MNVKKTSSGDPAATEAFEESTIPCSEERVVLFLYVAGLSARSTRAVDRIRSICDSYLAGRFQLTVVDLYLHPEKARESQIVVAPTLVKVTPIPTRHFIGDMADDRPILRGLNIIH